MKKRGRRAIKNPATLSPLEVAGFLKNKIDVI
jgi:hypothetical protein